MKDYTIRNYGDFGQIPRFHLLDSSIFILAGLGNEPCLRTVESQDKSELKFGFVHGTERQVINCLIKKYDGLGCSFVYNILKKRNFARVRLELGPSKLRKKIGGVDSDILKLAYLNEIESVVSMDFSHILGGHSKKNNFFTPVDFVKKYDSKLVKLDEEYWNQFKIMAKNEKGKPHNIEDFQDLWIVPYY